MAAAGEEVAAINVGDRVVTANAVGAYAEYSCAPADFVAYVPESMPSDAIASALLKGMTAHYLIKSVVHWCRPATSCWCMPAPAVSA